MQNPQNLSVSSALNPFSVTLPDSGAHLPAKGGTHVVWFGEDSTGTFIGSNYPAQTAKNGGSSAATQTGTLTSPSISLAGAAKAAIEFDSWWEIEGVAGQSYDMMIVQVSTNGSTWTEVGRLNPTFSTAAPSDSGYTAGGSSAPPEWRHYAFDVSSYAGQSIQVRFSFNTGDSAYNAFRGWTIDNLSVGAGDSLPAPTVTCGGPGRRHHQRRHRHLWHRLRAEGDHLARRDPDRHRQHHAARHRLRAGPRAQRSRQRHQVRRQGW